MLKMILPALAVVLSGVAVAVETPTNAELNRDTGSAALASLISFLVGAAVLGLVTLIWRPKLTAGWAVSVPTFAWLGGLYGAAAVLASAWATPKLGAATALVVIVAAQVALGVALDHFGALGLERHPAGVLRLAGCAVVIAGAAMVARG